MTPTTPRTTDLRAARFATQLTLGLDRDSALVAGGFDERDPAVKRMLSLAI